MSDDTGFSFRDMPESSRGVLQGMVPSVSRSLVRFEAILGRRCGGKALPLAVVVMSWSSKLAGDVTVVGRRNDCNRVVIAPRSSLAIVELDNRWGDVRYESEPAWSPCRKVGSLSLLPLEAISAAGPGRARRKLRCPCRLFRACFTSHAPSPGRGERNDAAMITPVFVSVFDLLCVDGEMLEYLGVA